MFSYRHAFHAGNHADVLKHAILCQILEYLNRKETSYWVVDTHAGAGLYDLQGDWAQKNSEAAQGIGLLWDRPDLPEMLQDYRQAVAEFNPPMALRFYPGSPWLALRAMRAQDRLRLFELHPTESSVLAGNLERESTQAKRQTTLYASDGYEGIKALLPPPPRRGLVLIDPPYEMKQDYRRAVQALQDGMQRFATGTYALWYPIVQRRESTELARQLERLPVDNWVHARLIVRKPGTDGLGLHGSGMFIINPPWTLRESLASTLPYLRDKLGQDSFASFTLTHREK